MTVWEILGLCALCAAALLFLLSFYFMRVACGRKDRSVPPLEVLLERPSYREYKRDILAGRDWIAAMQPEEISIRSDDGLRLAGQYLPCKNARATLLLFHGWHSSPVMDFGYAIREYYGFGLNLLLVQQRAQGGSEGRYMTFGVKEREDVHAWVRWHAERFGADAPILLGGLSMGASTVLMACEKPFSANVRGVIADCGFTTPYAIIRSVIRSAHLPAALLTALVGVQTRLFAGFSLHGASAPEAVKKTRLPVFLAHGEADHFVPCEMAKEIFAACQSADKTLLLVPGAGHGKSLPCAREEYLGKLRAFIDRALRP